MYKLLVLSCLLASVLAGPLDLESRRRPDCRGNSAEAVRACAGKNGSLAPHPRDCRAFYYCAGRAAVCLYCPFPLHFNPSRSACDWPQDAGCQLFTSTTSTTSSDASSTESSVVTDSTEAPSTESVEPSTESAEPSTESAEPSTESAEPSSESAEPSTESAEPSETTSDTSDTSTDTSSAPTVDTTTT